MQEKSNLTAAELLLAIFVRIPQASLGLVLQISGRCCLLSGRNNPLDKGETRWSD